MAKRLLTLVISLAYFTLRGGCRTLARLVPGKRVLRPPVVLAYHSVHGDEVARFDRQMRDLKTRTRPIFADESLSWNGRQRVAVTFDDGFRSVFDYALPVLAKYEIPATVFVPTGFLGTEPGWISRANGWARFPGPLASAKTLAASDSRQVRIGSHSVTHPHLADLHGSSLHRELVVSKQTLEAITDGTVRMLSFPYGSFNSAVLDAARAAGYARVFSNVPVPPSAGGDSVLVGRINVSPQDWPLEFRLKIQGAYGWLVLAIPAKRAVLRLLGRRHE